MYAKLMVGLGVLFTLSPLFLQAGTDQRLPPIPKKMDEIEQLLGRIEQDVEQLRKVLRRWPGEKEAADIRRTPEYRALENRFHALQRMLGAPGPRDPAQIWQAMGDPKELAKRLDTLVEAVAPTISDQGRREQFQKDVEVLKAEIGKELSEEELYEKVREMLSERLAEAVDAREKVWLQRQLDSLERSQGADRKAWIDRYIRIRNVRILYELAQRHSISREQMTKCGLAFVGYRHRPPGRPEGGPPGGRRPGRAPGPLREERVR